MVKGKSNDVQCTEEDETQPNDHVIRFPTLENTAHTTRFEDLIRVPDIQAEFMQNAN